MSPSKTFLLLPHRIPASEELLALTTTTPLSPLSSTIIPSSTYIPTLLTSSPSTTVITTTDAPGSLTLELSNAISFSLNLEPVLNLSTSHGQRMKYTIRAREIRKSRLKNAPAVFAKLMEDAAFKKQLRGLVSRKAYLGGKRAFFVTGVVSAVDASVEEVVGKEHSVKAKAMVPLDAVAGVPLPVLGDVGLGAGMDGESGRESRMVSRAVGKDVWGVEYMEVRREWWDADAAATRLGRVVEKVKGGTFFGDRHGDGTDEEDEDDDSWGLVGDTASVGKVEEIKAFIAEVE